MSTNRCPRQKNEGSGTSRVVVGMNRILLLVAALAACHPTDTAKVTDAHDTTTHVLRTYQIPPGHEKMVERLLRGNSYPITVTAGDKAVVQTQFRKLDPQFTGDGYFILSAPIGIHEGVKQLLEELKSRPTTAAGPSSIESSYWMVLGYPSTKTEISGQLEVIAPALKGLSDLGPMRFEPYETVQVTSLDGEESRATASRAEVRQTASADKDTIDVRLEIKVFGAESNSIIETS